MGVRPMHLYFLIMLKIALHKYLYTTISYLTEKFKINLEQALKVIFQSYFIVNKWLSKETKHKYTAIQWGSFSTRNKMKIE